MLYTKFLLFFIALHFLKYASRTEKISVSEWINTLCTPKIITFAKIVVILDLLCAISNHIVEIAVPGLAGILIEITKIGM